MPSALSQLVIPPENDAEFVANMEDVLEIYAKPYDSKVPVLCMDEHASPTGQGSQDSDRGDQEAS